MKQTLRIENCSIPTLAFSLKHSLSYASSGRPRIGYSILTGRELGHRADIGGSYLRPGLTVEGHRQCYGGFVSTPFMDREVARAQPVPPRGYALASEEGIPGRGSDVKASNVSTGGSVAIYCTVLDGAGPPMHQHRHEDETLYVLDGVVEAACGPDLFVGERGSTIFLPRGLPHTFRSVDGPAEFLFIVTPGHLDEFFRQRDTLSDPSQIGRLIQSYL